MEIELLCPENIYLSASAENRGHVADPGDQTVLRDLRSGDRVEAGGLYRICGPEDRSGLRTLLNQRLIQAGVSIIKANYQPAELTEQNDRTNHLVQSLTNPGLGLTPFATGGLSHVDFILVHSRPYLEVQVDQI